MIYPKEIQDWILEERPEGGEFQRFTFPGDLNKTDKPVYEEDFSFELWLKEKGAEAGKPVQGYLGFVKEMGNRFLAVSRQMAYENPCASHQHGHDRWATGWAGAGMLPLALYIYYLHSFGIGGSVLECGVFKGGSTCCLSWVCDYLGIRLLSADSFDGLPGWEGHYSRGDFKGSLSEVRDNVARFGRIDSVEFIEGLYADSLAGLDEDLMLIWLDVDLKQSVLDALGNAYSRLVPGGVIFSDGLVDVVDYRGDEIRDGGGEPAGLYQFFSENRIPYKAKPAGPKGLSLIVPDCGDDESLLYQARKHDILVFG